MHRRALRTAYKVALSIATTSPGLATARRTVETYGERAMEKLGLENLAGLMKFVIRQGIVPLEAE